MISISSRKFRDNQNEYLKLAQTEEVILTTLHFGRFRLVPINEEAEAKKEAAPKRKKRTTASRGAGVLYGGRLQAPSPIAAVESSAEQHELAKAILSKAELQVNSSEENSNAEARPAAAEPVAVESPASVTEIAAKEMPVYEPETEPKRELKQELEPNPTEVPVQQREPKPQPAPEPEPALKPETKQTVPARQQESSEEPRTPGVQKLIRPVSHHLPAGVKVMSREALAAIQEAADVQNREDYEGPENQTETPYRGHGNRNTEDDEPKGLLGRLFGRRR